MRPILQSRYLTLEYILWGEFNKTLLKEYDLSLTTVNSYTVDSRNLISLLTVSPTEQWLLKQYTRSENVFQIENEHTALQFLSGTSFKELVPEIVFFDPYNGILATKYWKDVKNVSKIIENLRGHSQWPTITIHVIAIAKMIKRLHMLPIKNNSLKIYDKEQILNLGNKNPTECHVKDTLYLYQNWKGTSIVHFDPRLDNILDDNQSNFRLIDWEFAMIADPIVDIATFIVSLCCTLGSDSFFVEPPTPRFAKVKRIVDAFCAAYFDGDTDYKDKLKVVLRLKANPNGTTGNKNYISTIDSLISE